MYTTITWVGNIGHNAELFTWVVVRPVFESVDGLYVYDFCFLLERIGPCAVILVVTLLVNSVTLVIDSKDLLRPLALIGNAKEIRELWLQGVDTQLGYLVGILDDLFQTLGVPRLLGRVNA